MSGLRTHLVKIGNSQGIRIPKAVIQQIHLLDEVDIEIKKDCLVIKPAENPRAGWAEAFRLAGKDNASDLDDWKSLPIASDEEEWQWK